MKKVKILLAALLLSVATFSGYKAYQAYSISQDDLLMQNLEALADGELGDGRDIEDGALVICDKEAFLGAQCYKSDYFSQIPCKWTGNINNHC